MLHTASTKHRSRMTDVPLGMLAERKCLEKGGGSPKCNTEALSCFCRRLYFLHKSDHQMSPLKHEFPTTTAVLVKIHVHEDNHEWSHVCCRKTQILKNSPTMVSSIQSAAFRLNKTNTTFNYSPVALTKGNSALQNHFLSNVAPNTSYLTNRSLFEVQTRKNEGAFLGLALHMTAIWGYCVFWPKRVVYDR